MKHMYVTAWHITMYGTSAGCPGCFGNGEHNEECGGRIIDAMKEDKVE